MASYQQTIVNIGVSVSYVLYIEDGVSIVQEFLEKDQHSKLMVRYPGVEGIFSRFLGH